MSLVRVVSLVITLLIATTILSAVPNLVNYQGRLTDNDGNPVPDGDYNITFYIWEHENPGMGEDPIWTSGVRSITVSDGLFSYVLGSNVPLPASVFADNGWASHYLRVGVEGTMLTAVEQLVAVPFAYKAISADTAGYAIAGPGSGSAGWVDDGSVVRLESSGDRVGIGTSSPEENLVVGGNLGAYPEANYIVSANPNFEGFSGFKLGYNSDNHATLSWYGDGDQLSIGTRFMGTSFDRTLVLRGGNVGIGVDYPLEPLVVGGDLGAYYGDFVQIARTGTGRYSGFMCGEDADNRGAMLWYNNSNELRLGYKTGGTDYGAAIVLRDGEALFSGTGNNSVQLGNDAIGKAEILDEPGIAHSRVTDVTLDDGWSNITSFGVEAPAEGYILVIVSLSANSYLPASSADDQEARVWVCISDTTSGCDYQSPDTYTHFWHFGNFIDHTFTFHKLLPISSAGTRLIYINGMGLSYSPPSQQYPVECQASVSAIYLPTWYGNMAPPTKASTDSPAKRLNRIKPADFNRNFTESDRLAELEAEIKALKDQVAELQQK